MIYEYRCKTCEEVKEYWMKLSDPHPTECPHCGPAELERVISKTSFALKGTGWYTTDYKKRDSGAGEKKDGSKDSKEKSKEGNKACPSGACSKNTN